MGADQPGSHQNDGKNYQEQAPPPPPPPHYGTFEGVPHHPASSFPQPAPPPGYTANPPQYYAHGYQPERGYAVAEGIHVRQHRRLPCCGIGFGWFLFILGFFLGAIPWYLAAFVMLLSRIDPREKPGYVACTVAAILATIAIIFGATHR